MEKGKEDIQDEKKRNGRVGKEGNGRVRNKGSEELFLCV